MMEKSSSIREDRKGRQDISWLNDHLDSLPFRRRLACWVDLEYFVLNPRERPAIGKRTAIPAVADVVGTGVVVPAIRFCNLFQVRVQFDELIGDIDQAWAGVASKARQFHAHAFVGYGVYRV